MHDDEDPSYEEWAESYDIENQAPEGCYALRYGGKTIQRSNYVDELFYARQELVEKGLAFERFRFVDELSSDEDITESVGCFMRDIGALRSR